MKILSIVTLISPLGEYGGPVRVALNQAHALRERGHEVLTVGAYRGFPDGPPHELQGVPVQLFRAANLLPRIGFAGVGAPGLWAWVRSNAAQFDVVHIHAARDLVTLPAARIVQGQGVPFLLQTHGMIDPSSKKLAGLLDAILTKRILGGAASVLYLTQAERAGLAEVGGGSLPLTELPNGVPWAEEENTKTRSQVLYLARLAPRKRPSLFVDVATALSPKFPDTDFVMVGPDEGQGDAIQAAISSSRSNGVRIRWEGALPPDQTLLRMRQASVYVLPAIDEPYPMSVLEAMSVGLPVVVTESCGLADFIAEVGGGVVVEADADSLIEAVRGLLADPTEGARMGARGKRAVREHLGMGVIAETFEGIYQNARLGR